MPLSPSYDWKETEIGVEVVVQLTGITKDKTHVFCTDRMLKINSPPYLLILDLLDEVDDSKSTATITPTAVTFKLVKVCYM